MIPHSFCCPLLYSEEKQRDLETRTKLFRKREISGSSTYVVGETSNGSKTSSVKANIKQARINQLGKHPCSKIQRPQMNFEISLVDRLNVGSSFKSSRE